MDSKDFDWKIGFTFLGWAVVIILLSAPFGGELSYIAKWFWLACSVSGMIYFGTDIHVKRPPATAIAGTLGSAIFGPVVWLTFLTVLLTARIKLRRTIANRPKDYGWPICF